MPFCGKWNFKPAFTYILAYEIMFLTAASFLFTCLEDIKILKVLDKSLFDGYQDNGSIFLKFSKVIMSLDQGSNRRWSDLRLYHLSNFTNFAEAASA